MSRCIQFRVWDPHVKSYLANQWAGEESHVDAAGVFEPEVSGRTLQQFTGLKDRLGRDIYEGDIVSFSIPGITHGPERDDVTDAEVYWSDEDACFLFGRYHVPARPYPQGFLFDQSSEPYDWGYSIADRIDIKTFEVTGNIFDRAAARTP